MADMLAIENLYGNVVTEAAPKPTFKNYIEAFEKNCKTKDDNLYALLRKKYMGIRIRDTDEEEDYDELREIIGIIWQAKSPRGYYLETQLVNQKTNNLFRGDDTKEAYIINDDTHELLIKQENNESLRFIDDVSA